jgi:hypothetical protein
MQSRGPCRLTSTRFFLDSLATCCAETCMRREGPVCMHAKSTLAVHHAFRANLPFDWTGRL